ncbi:MAG: NAD(P)/FAD-dependent oxidoreductase [Acidobacteria bacterium]|nr:NAD(P)/FAD-dependent oxidoreductase [Acidobacteriota bacterium]
MNNQPIGKNRKSKIVIAGAGPAGSSLAIRLANLGFAVTLIEREKFPRHKLCGEFVSPECLEHFRELGVLDAMLGVGGDRIVRTSFFSLSGKSVSVSSDWLGSGGGALSISRSVMDDLLLKRAREAGVEVLEETQVTGLEVQDGLVKNLRAKSGDSRRFEISGDLFVDATGRAGHVAKFVSKSKTENPKTRNRLVGFKAHLENVHLEPGNCEIYFFDGGYGGLSFVENGLANHCFLVSAERFKEAGSVDRLLETVIFKNKRAFAALRDSQPVIDWIAVSVEGFGRRELLPAHNLFAVGDAAAFIDPFTGSGMLMAFESASILAAAIGGPSNADIGAEYSSRYESKFARRLWVCGLLRRAAFWPRAASTVIAALGFSRNAVMHLAQATRGRSASSVNRPGT